MSLKDFFTFFQKLGFGQMTLCIIGYNENYSYKSKQPEAESRVRRGITNQLSGDKWRQYIHDKSFGKSSASNTAGNSRTPSKGVEMSSGGHLSISGGDQEGGASMNIQSTTMANPPGWDQFMNVKSDYEPVASEPRASEPNEKLREWVGYPCGHSRLVTVGKRGWNRCSVCRRNHSVHHIAFLETESRVN